MQIRCVPSRRAKNLVYHLSAGLPQCKRSCQRKWGSGAPLNREWYLLSSRRLCCDFSSPIHASSCCRRAFVPMTERDEFSFWVYPYIAIFGATHRVAVGSPTYFFLTPVFLSLDDNHTIGIDSGVAHPEKLRFNGFRQTRGLDVKS